MSDRPIPTLEEFKENMLSLRETLDKLTFHKEYTIEDYPIGGNHRGQCKLTSERKKGHGYRMVKQTTNRYGRWCTPKTTTYQNSVICVVTGEPVEREAAWLDVCVQGVFLNSATFDQTVLIWGPRQASREPRPYKINDEHHELPADKPHDCDLWDLWKPTCIELMQWAKAKFEELHGIVAKQG